MNDRHRGRLSKGLGSSERSFQPIPFFDDASLARIFAHEVLAFLVARDLISTEFRDKILSWRHTGFNVHSKVRAATGPGRPGGGHVHGQAHPGSGVPLIRLGPGAKRESEVGPHPDGGNS
jgi:hypothetical protein